MYVTQASKYGRNERLITMKANLNVSDSASDSSFILQVGPIHPPCYTGVYYSSTRVSTPY